MAERFYLAVVSVTEGCTIIDRLSLTGVFRWAEHLDDDDQQKMLEALAGRSNWTPQQLHEELHAWKATAEVLADPKAREVLLADGFTEGDFVEVRPPGDYVFGGIVTEVTGGGVVSVVIPFGRPEGIDAGSIVLNLDEARVLRDMLNGVLEEHDGLHKLSYIQSMTAPLSEAEIEALNKALASGNPARFRRPLPPGEMRDRVLAVLAEEEPLKERNAKRDAYLAQCIDDDNLESWGAERVAARNIAEYYGDKPAPVPDGVAPVTQEDLDEADRAAMDDSDIPDGGFVLLARCNKCREATGNGKQTRLVNGKWWCTDCLPDGCVPQCVEDMSEEMDKGEWGADVIHGDVDPSTRALVSKVTNGTGAIEVRAELDEDDYEPNQRTIDAARRRRQFVQDTEERERGLREYALATERDDARALALALKEVLKEVCDEWYVDDPKFTNKLPEWFDEYNPGRKFWNNGD